MKKLCLGTVQFGLNYGINNLNGKPTFQESLKMLEHAWQKGVRVYDTAEAYGNAQEILGEFVRAHGLTKEIKVISKLLPNCLEDKKSSVAEIVWNNLENTLNKLHLDKLDGYLYHTPAYIYNDEAWASFQDIKKNKLVDNIGVSVYEYEDGLYAAQKQGLDYLQISYSILDQRFSAQEFKEVVKNSNIKVFARSAFLQGLLFMSEENLVQSMPEAKTYLRQIKDILFKNKIRMAECAMKFSLKEDFIDYLVFGVDNIGQLEEDFEISLERNKLIGKKELQNNFRNIPKSIIFPSLWKRN